MRRTVARTKRHLDDPLLIGPFTIAQCVAIGLGVLILLAALAWAPEGTPFDQRLLAGMTLGSVPSLAVFWVAAQGLTVTHVLRRVWRYARERREYLPGPPTRGAEGVELYDGRAEDDPDDD